MSTFRLGIFLVEKPHSSSLMAPSCALCPVFTSQKFIKSRCYIQPGFDPEKYVYMEEHDFNKKLILGEEQNLGWYHLSDLKELKIVDHDKEILKYIKDKY